MALYPLRSLPTSDPNFRTEMGIVRTEMGVDRSGQGRNGQRRNRTWTEVWTEVGMTLGQGKWSTWQVGNRRRIDWAWSGY